MTQRIAIVGASVRAAAQSAVRAGFEVVAYDLFADQDLRAIAQVKQAEHYPHDAKEWLAQQNVDGWMYTGAWENYPELVDELAAIRPLWGNPASVLRAVRDPLRLQEFCRANEILFPDTLPAIGPASRVGKWLHKTGRGASGSGVQRIMPMHEYTGGYFQNFIPGLPHSALYLGAQGQARLVGVTQQILGQPGSEQEFQYTGSFAPAPQLTKELWQRMGIIGERLAANFNLVGLFGVDFVLTSEGPCVIEINPRYTAAMELAERLQYPAAIADHVTACRQAILPDDLEFSSVKQRWVKNIYFSRIVQTVDEDFLWLLNPKCNIGELVDLPALGTILRAGDPVCTLIAKYHNWNDSSDSCDSSHAESISFGGLVGFLGSIDTWINNTTLRNGLIENRNEINKNRRR
jgi:uncharacterized protein